MDRSRDSGTYDTNSYRRGNRGVAGIPGRVAGIRGGAWAQAGAQAAGTDHAGGGV